jgi:MFS family permease
MSMAMSLAMVSTYLPKSVRGSAIGVVTLAASAGTAFGPAIGGVLTTFHWSYIFFINVPIGIICIILSMKYMSTPESDVKTEKKKLDLVGAALLFIMLFSLIFYLNKGDELGWTSNKGLLLLVTMFVAGGMIAWWEQRAADPLISLRLIGNKQITGANIVGMLMFMAMGGSYLLLPYYLGYVQGYETVEYGLILIANSVGMMAAGPAVGRIADRTGGNKRFIVLGCLVAAAGFFMMTMFDGSTSLWFILAALFVMGAGMGMALVASTNLAFGYSRDGEDGQMSGLTNTFRQAGSSTGVAVLNAIFMGSIIVTSTSIDLVPGFRRAFFVAVLIALAAFVVAMGLKNVKPAETKNE